MFNACIIIPVYDHEGAIEATCTNVRPLGLPIILIDDGSHEPCAQLLDQLKQRENHYLVRLTRNCGKGAAVRAGLAEAERLGFTHALQIDADGQHDVADLPPFLKSAQQFPEAMTIGYPCFDESVPRHRYYSRYITHVWVWINTLSLTIRDSMCGVRLYPLGALNRMLHRYSCGNRMEFDTEVLVRWYWRGGKINNLPVHVHYPLDGVSHFRLFRDNVLMARMHLRLTVGMLLRAYRLYTRRTAERQHGS
ncbi:glycosyltransferase family 2 protein [Phytohalomonas tamaricis]|uniref:glycosyltransferase family 2 protein n=1 Tax=Phytohalomonas tamaricis TaxID=2081032 RepID=UPI000D0BD989|nr:glycosyltransferase family 2 protein [Phytohalomonas tamaricis]